MARMPEQGAQDQDGPGLHLVSAARKPSMTSYDVLVVIDAAARIDPAAELALRLAAVTGARRAELAALRWDDLDGHRLTIDSSIVARRTDGGGGPGLIDASIKFVGARTVCIDRITVQMIERLRTERERIGPYMFSAESGPPNPDRISRWWQKARDQAGVSGAPRLDELHHSFGATVVHVLEFAGQEVEYESRPDSSEEDDRDGDYDYDDYDEGLDGSEHATGVVRDVEVLPPDEPIEKGPRREAPVPRAIRDLSNRGASRELSLPLVLEVTAAVLVMVVFVLLRTF